MSDSSEDECVDCGETWSTEKGLNCELCGDFWCVDWQSAFVQLSKCQCSQDCHLDFNFVCPSCFVNLACRSPSCETSIAFIKSQPTTITLRYSKQSIVLNPFNRRNFATCSWFSPNTIH